MTSQEKNLADHNKKVIPYTRAVVCFVSPAGNDKIREWYENLKAAERAVADEFIKNVRRKKEWSMPDYRHSLSGSKDHRRLGELRWECLNVQHRLVGYLDGETFVALIGCTHKQRRYNPSDALDSAVERRKQLKNGIAKHCPYAL